LVCLQPDLDGSEKGRVTSLRRAVPAVALSALAIATTAGCDNGWWTYHRDPARTGVDSQLAVAGRVSAAWTTNLDGAVYAQPLVVGSTLVAATENDSLYGLDANTGAVRWRTHVASPVSRSALPCGNVDPLGITGTPAYDPASKLVFAVAETQSAGKVTHLLAGVDPASGQQRMLRPIDPPASDPTVSQQRGALTVTAGRVYVPYGGLAGDCGAYRGTVVASSTTGTGPLISYTVPTAREGGIWTPPGPVVDRSGNLLVQVGNSAATSGAWDGGDSVLKLSPDLRLLDSFAPASWAWDNAVDADLGSTAPSLTANGYLLAVGKSSTAYTLRAGHLGGIGGQVTSSQLCAAYGGTAVAGNTVYVPCTDGLRAVSVDSAGAPHVLWHTNTAVTGSPVVGGGLVWSLNPAGTLYGLDPGTGAVKAQLPTSRTSRFASPTLFNDSVLVPTLTGISAFRGA